MGPGHTQKSPKSILTITGVIPSGMTPVIENILKTLFLPSNIFTYPVTNMLLKPLKPTLSYSHRLDALMN